MTDALYQQAVLVIDPGMHTATIYRADADAEGRWAVTGSEDKTVRVWSLADGTLQRTLRLPAGPGNVGKVFAVAISPDGALIAAGGWTRWIEADPQQQIYLFDRESGKLVRRIDGLPNVVNHLAFSPDGLTLAATLGGANGLRLYSRARDWAETARDADYGDHSNGATFAAPDGRLATTSYDGKIRLYPSVLAGNLRPSIVVTPPGGHRPFGIAFSPDGTRLAVGYADSQAIDILDGHTLAALPGPDLRGIDNGNLGRVAWSRDGQTLFAGGSYWQDGRPVLAWDRAGAGARRLLPAAQDTVMSLVPLPQGDLLVAAGDPWLGRLGPDGAARWSHALPMADFRNQEETLAVSQDGTRIDFGFSAFGKQLARFDLAARSLRRDPHSDEITLAPRHNGLSIEGWNNTPSPTLGGQKLPLEPYERSQSVAVHPFGDRFVLGADWFLRAFDAKGTALWQRPAPGAVWAVNITGDGRLVVAAYSDGTIRWHRMSDGVELLAFMPLPDQTNWVAWTPEGFYAATPGARGILRWHVNHGWDPAGSVPIEDIPGSHRPAALPFVLQEMETARALGLADMAKHRQQVALRTSSRLPAGATLHLLAIGVSTHNAAAARWDLQYADRDARAVCNAIQAGQESLYTVSPQLLRNGEATRTGILRGFQTLSGGVRQDGRDLVVVFFSGHGAMVDDRLFLIPHDIDARDATGIKSTAFSSDELKREVQKLAQRARVLLLLDACHSGAMGFPAGAAAMNSVALCRLLASSNVNVLTSCGDAEVSLEDHPWQHGAFTKALLDAFAGADEDDDGLISATDLANYLTRHVPRLTGGRQTPTVELRDNITLFAAGA